MKKEFKALLTMKDGYLQISKIAKLHRWTEDGLGNPVDKLSISFDSPTGRVSFYEAEIGARDTEGITREIMDHTKAFAEKWAAEEANEMLAGNINGKIWGEEA